MHQDYEASELNGDPNEELPSYEKVRKIYEIMYDSFHGKSSAKTDRPEKDLNEDTTLEDGMGIMFMGQDEGGSMSMGYDSGHLDDYFYDDSPDGMYHTIILYCI